MIEAISSIQNISMVSESMNIDQKEHVSSNFLQLMQSSLETVNSDLKASDDIMQRYMVDKNVSTHELMIAMEQAKHSLQVSVQVRNKLVEAYKQVLQMQI
ncbi:Flagellar hook-basal body complex protein FliE [Thalassocella blandensis]|nr:Flagellar hook-basal body complex protein FliE [Thalassocella blandensis]